MNISNGKPHSGYEYDIFISYRQKDNKHDAGWRSLWEFKGWAWIDIQGRHLHLFRWNPHDRLQETYNVSKSLEGKLKCLIFIPILSQTYCDPASYACSMSFWRSSADWRWSFRKDVRLKGGNFTSRILPIRIHDLDSDDVKLLRKRQALFFGNWFVFKTSSGVNRPLMAIEDHPNDNLNKPLPRPDK